MIPAAWLWMCRMGRFATYQADMAMRIRILVNLAKRWRLIDDNDQWILQYDRDKLGKKPNWQGVAWIGSRSIDVLCRDLRERAQTGERLSLMQAALWWHQLHGSS